MESRRPPPPLIRKCRILLEETAERTVGDTCRTKHLKTVHPPLPSLPPLLAHRHIHTHADSCRTIKHQSPRRRRRRQKSSHANAGWNHADGRTDTVGTVISFACDSRCQNRMYGMGIRDCHVYAIYILSFTGDRPRLIFACLG